MAPRVLPSGSVRCVARPQGVSALGRRSARTSQGPLRTDRLGRWQGPPALRPRSPRPAPVLLRRRRRRSPPLGVVPGARTAPACFGHGRQARNRRPPVPSVAEARVDVLRGRAAPAGWLCPPRPRRKAQRRPLLGPDSSRKTDRLHLGRRGRPLRRAARPGGRPLSPGRPRRGLPERRARLGQRRRPGTGAAPRPRRGAAARALARVRASRRERRGHAAGGRDEARASPEDRHGGRGRRSERTSGGGARDERAHVPRR